MDVTFKPKKLEGQLNIASSKSFAHRAIVFACLAKGISKIKNINLCDDVKNTINLLREDFGINIKDDNLEICGGLKNLKKTNFQIKESAATLRLLFPFLSYFSQEKTTFELGDRLFERGIEEYEKIYQKNNLEIKKTKNKLIVDKFPLENYYTVSSEVSSQYASGLIILAVAAKQETTINIQNTENSLGYIDLTIKLANEFGAKVKRVGNNVFVMGNQELKNKEIFLPSDASFALNCEVINMFGSNVVLKTALDCDDPDYKLYEKINKNKEVDGEIDLSNNPDALLPLSIIATKSKKPTIFKNIERINNKESNRVDNLLSVLNSFGIKAEVIRKKDLIVYPGTLKPANLSSFNDHRFAFLGLILSTVVDSDITVYNFDSASKSYPNILKDFKKLGAEFEVFDSIENKKYKFENETPEIVVGRKATNTLKEYKSKNNKKILFVDSGVDEHKVEFVKELLGLNVVTYTFKNKGETIKTIDSFEKIIRFLLENEVSKTDTLFTLGGGSVSDLIGFVSSVYKRGIDYVSIPTTLLSMVDASIGGKNGIDLDNYKNVIGSFKNPQKTIIDFGFLDTLPKNELKSGMAEIIKIAALSDSNLFYDIYDSEPYQKIELWAKKAINLKIKFVEKDPLDKNERHALNFGHTNAHAIEINNKLSHGEAVAVGMMQESKNKLLKEVLEKYGFENKQYLINDDIIKNDKKIENNEIILVDIEEIGAHKFKKLNYEI